MAMDSQETQRALLQPIKQLDKNWDIDIAAELEDYLHELAGTTFTINDQRHLNFAEAAMMIHSSSCTYGKKVDYLMKLCLAALESAKQQRQQQEAQGSTRRRRVRSLDAAVHRPFPVVREFWVVRDCMMWLPASRNKL